MQSQPCLFVYGTLRREWRTPQHQLLEQHAQFQGCGHIRARLYEVDRYPAAVLSDGPADRVVGEVYRLMNASLIFQALDRYEACSEHCPLPHEYTRRLANVTLQNNLQIRAWIYAYNLPTEGLLPIPSGDYLEFLERS